jgi:hypothetical protein
VCHDSNSHVARPVSVLGRLSSRPGRPAAALCDQTLTRGSACSRYGSRTGGPKNDAWSSWVLLGPGDTPSTGGPVGCGPWGAGWRMLTSWGPGPTATMEVSPWGLLTSCDVSVCCWCCGPYQAPVLWTISWSMDVSSLRTVLKPRMKD